MSTLCHRLAITDAADGLLSELYFYTGEWADLDRLTIKPRRGTLLYAEARGWIELDRASQDPNFWTFRLTKQGRIEADPSLP